jgi:TatD DNase family protein
MSSRLPAVDLHAHIDIAIAGSELTQLPGIVFAASRTLTESQAAVQRRDSRVVWGAGCHPGLARNHTTFDVAIFEELVGKTAYVSEIGLDGSAKVGLPRQIPTFQAILNVLQRHPRISSIHSYSANEEVLAALTERPIRGAILHWWLGTPAQTNTAVDLGCYFSLNASSIRRIGSIGDIPRDRVLTETDHPFGDRTSAQPRLPGNTFSVETSLAAHYGRTQAQMRAILWQNLSRLTSDVGCAALLSRDVLTHLAAAG